MKEEKIGMTNYISLLLLTLMVILFFTFGNRLSREKSDLEIKNRSFQEILFDINQDEHELSKMISNFDNDTIFDGQEYLKIRADIEKKLKEIQKYKELENALVDVDTLLKLNQEITKFEKDEKYITSKENLVYGELLNEFNSGLKTFNKKGNDVFLDKMSENEKTRRYINMIIFGITIVLFLQTLILFLKIEKYIKHHKKLMDEIEEANLNLEDKVEQRTKEVAIKSKELEKGMLELETLSKELKDKAHFEEGLSKLNYVLTGSLEISDACQRALEIIGKFIKFQSAIIYIINKENSLEKSAGFSLASNYNEKFEIGVGLVGESAKQKKIILEEDIPEKSLVMFGQGGLKPIQIIEIPLVYNDFVGGVLELTLQEKLKDEELQWLEKAGDILALDIYVILESKKLQGALKEVEETKENVHNIIDSTVEGIYGIDSFGNISFLNNGILSLFDFESKEFLLGKTHNIILNKIFEYNEHHKGREFLNGESVEIEDLFYKKNRSEFWLDLIFNPIIKDKEIIGSVVTIRDITEKRVIELENKKQKGLLSGLVKSIPGLVFYKDLKGNYIGSNEQFARLNGLTVDTIIGKNDYDLYEENRARLYIESDKNIFTTQENYNLEEMVEDSQGEERFFHTIKSLLKSEDGEILGILGISHDISEIKRAEKELQIAKEMAEGAAKVKADFLANMSHEIRTPMNAIIGLNNLLEKTELTKKQIDYVKKIGNSAKNLLGIINDILDFSKIEAGKLKMELLDFQLEDVLENVSNVIGTKAFEKGLEFVIDKDPKLPETFVGDSLRLNQVLINLANNAVKFTDEGQVVLTIKKLDSFENKITLMFSIDDTGIGMTEDQLMNLFKAFTQGDLSTTRKYGGTGLGLSISRNIVNMMGGEITVTSEYKKGSSFRFTIVMEKGSLSHKKNVVPATINGLNVLVADDNDAAREVMDNYLRSFGMHPILVDSGEEALMNVNEKTDLILMDWKMKGISGIEAWKEIKEKLSGKKLPKIIMITAYGLEEVTKEALDTNVNQILIKPVGQSMLYDTIVTIFGTGLLNEKESKEKGTKSINPRGIRVLLVEDNDINQQVAKESLEHEGFIVSIAENGQIALDMVKENRFDLVLMDLQMPVMDGYIATKEIRKIKEFEGLPIIALSADAMEGTREKVLEAGMNDYVSKPINLNELFYVISKWHKNIDLEVSDSPLRNFDYADGLERLNGNKKLYEEILVKFAHNNRDLIEKIKKSLEDNEIELAKRELHSLKGVSANLGSKKIQALSLSLENRLKNNEDILLHEDFEILKKTLEESISDIGNFIKNTDVIEGGHLSREEISKKLKEIRFYAENYDIKANEILQGLIEPVKALGLGIEILTLERFLSEYDYEKALDICHKLEEGI